MVAGAAIVWSTGGLIVRHVDGRCVDHRVLARLFRRPHPDALLAVRDGRNIVALFRNWAWPGLGVAVCFGTRRSASSSRCSTPRVAIILFLQSASPLIAGGLAWLWLGERMTWIKAATMVLALIGVGVTCPIRRRTATFSASRCRS